MKLVQGGFICLIMLAVADSVLPPPPPGGVLVGIVDGIVPPPLPSVGFGAMSGIFGFLILLTFLIALSRHQPPGCTSNCIPTPREPNTCIRFFTDLQTFADARKNCQNFGGDLLRLDIGNFFMIQQLANANKGTLACNFWVGAQEVGIVDGNWRALNGDLIPVEPGIFFQAAADVTNTPTGIPGQCGALDNGKSFFLNGFGCEIKQCYICKRNC